MGSTQSDDASFADVDCNNLTVRGVINGGGGGGGTQQVFAYVAVGGEANPFTVGAVQGFTARTSVNYNVQCTIARPAANSIKTPSIISTTIGLASFQVETSAALELGDVLQFTVEDR